ncbi:unnamed protein product [Musa acuminata var. zebrina]
MPFSQQVVALPNQFYPGKRTTVSISRTGFLCSLSLLFFASAPHLLLLHLIFLFCDHFPRPASSSLSLLFIHGLLRRLADRPPLSLLLPHMQSKLDLSFCSPSLSLIPQQKAKTGLVDQWKVERGSYPCHGLAVYRRDLMLALRKVHVTSAIPSSNRSPISVISLCLLLCFSKVVEKDKKHNNPTAASLGVSGVDTRKEYRLLRLG